MLGLSGFFKNIQNSFTKEIVLRTEIKDSIKKITNIDISIEKITCKNGIVYIKEQNQSALSLIYIKKQKILLFLKTEFKKDYIKDIRS